MKNLNNREKKNLLFLSWRDIKAPKKGGAEIFTHEMLKRLDPEEYQITHFSPEYEGCAADEVIEGIRYIRKGGLLSVIWEARRYYTEHAHEVDYVVDQCNTHRFFTRLWVEDGKRIFFIHQLTREIWDMNTSFPVNFIGKYTETPFLRLSRRDPTITVSESTRNDLVDIGFIPENVTILPEGIDFEPWPVERFHPKEGAPTFIYVGRYSNYKGIDKAVMAFSLMVKRYSDARLWIVGKKKEEYIKEVLAPILESNSITYGDEDSQVVFWGFVSEEMKLELMSRAHCLLFPSLREGWGLIITEAAAVGTPSIGFDSAGIRDALDRGRAGYLCSENTVDNLLTNMVSVIEDRDRYEDMRRSSYEYSKKFHWNNTKKAFTDFIEALEGER